jgi:tetratricopeptide (TPR) repeat protein
LQHPGIPPVHVVGRLDDGRPFFAMKLIRGRTLAELLEQRSSPTADLPRLLDIFEKVCQTLAFAHSRRVIHRDLKPSNIMVGAFGEVQVMDWGLAKVLAEGGIADEERASRQHQPEAESLIRTARGSGSTGSGTETEAGSLLGTPAYMPPEQANGDVALLDRRCDVFGLGAILCEVLTGMPPYVGRSPEELRRKAANGDLADATARLDGCGADQELITLTRACLAPETIDRPRDAQAVADSLTAYQGGVQERLQAAQRQRAVALAQEIEQRKRRRVQLALAGAVVVLLLGGGAFAWWQREQVQAVRARHGHNAEAVAALLQQCQDALHKDDTARAALTLEGARKRAAEGGADDLAGRLDALAEDLLLLRDLDAIDQFRWTWADSKWPDAKVVATRTREALARFGADPDAVLVDKAVARVSASAVRERIVMALDRLLRVQNSAEVRAVLRRVDANPYRDAVRDAVLAGNHWRLWELAGQAAALEQPPGFAAFLGNSSAIAVERRRQLLEAAVSRRSGNLGLLMSLSMTYPIDQKDGANERLRWLQAAIAAAPGNTAAHNGLGVALDQKGKVEEAIACYHKAIALNPKLAAAHSNLGLALKGKGKVDEAIACWRKAIALDPKLAKAHSNLGAALYGKGKVDEAIACYRKAVALDPKDAAAHANLGAALASKGQWDEAIVRYQKAIALDPKLARVHTGMGYALYGKGQVDEAIACYHKATLLDPKDATAHAHLGNALARKGQLDEAIACFRRTIEVAPKDAIPHYHLGNALKDKGKVEEAIACYHKAIALNPKLAAAHSNLGAALYGKGKVDEAIACWRKAIALDPKLAGAHSNLGTALYGKGQVEESIACYHKAIEIDPKYAKAHSGLGLVLLSRGRYVLARDALARALTLFPVNHPLRAIVSGQLQKCVRFLKLEARLPGILREEEQPASALECLDLARMCVHKKRNATATRLSATAFAADPKLADDLQARHRYNAACSAALAAAGQGEDAAKLDDQEGARLRKQALDWLRADLAMWSKLLSSAQPAARTAVQQKMQHWRRDRDLAGIREKAALDKLPAEERQQWQRLWHDVDALLRAVAPKE